MTTSKIQQALSASRLFQPKKVAFSVAVLIIFHGVGLWGLLFSGNPEYYQNLTPLNLLLTNFLLFLNHKTFSRTFWLFVFVTFTIGFLAEVLGVHTGLLFGNYIYGEALGFKLWEVPLIIGLNWVMLVYSAGTIANKLSFNSIIKVFFAAGIMVALDFFIEPAAMKYDFWSWQNNEVPVTNYVGWLGLALLLQHFFQRVLPENKNPVAPLVIYLQAAFFIALNLFI